MYYEAVDPKHKAKEKAKARTLRASQWWKLQIAAGVCYYCEQKHPKGELTMDHKVPVSRGGQSTKSNVVVACKDCNTKKKHLTPAEMFLQESDDDK